ncbi:MAG: SRPBCC domain-containing protein [Nitrososphaerales archaeon]
MVDRIASYLNPETDQAKEHGMASDAQGSTRLLGSLASADERGVVRMQDRLDADADDVWSALTDPIRLALWLGEIEGDLHLGGEFRAHFYASGWEGTGRIEACEPSQRLLVWTKDADQPDEGPIEVTLTADGDQTIVVWEERGMPLDLLAAYGAGIQIHVEDLKDHVVGHERRDAKARFEALFPSYQQLATTSS